MLSIFYHSEDVQDTDKIYMLERSIQKIQIWRHDSSILPILPLGSARFVSNAKWRPGRVVCLSVLAFRETISVVTVHWQFWRKYWMDATSKSSILG
jgi:hypothetical protein